MPCSHETFESAVVVTAREEVRPEGTAISYLVTVQARCTACQGPLIFDLPPAHPHQDQVVAMAQGGTEARLLARMVAAEVVGAALTWTPAPTRHPAPPPPPEPPPVG